MKQYRWDFVIAEVSHPLLDVGADFLPANSLLVGLKGKQLMDAKNLFFFSAL